MAAVHAIGYRFRPERLEEGLAAARDSLALFSHLGARASLRETVVGGESTGVYTALAMFKTATERADFMDQLGEPEHRAGDGLAVAERNADSAVTLVGRLWLNQMYPGDSLPTDHAVVLAGRIRISPGHALDAEEILRAWKRDREELGIEAHLWTPALAGPGMDRMHRYLSIGGESWAQWQKDQDRLQSVHRTDRTPLERGLESGAITISQSMSVLVIG